MLIKKHVFTLYGISLRLKTIVMALMSISSGDKGHLEIRSVKDREKRDSFFIWGKF